MKELLELAVSVKGQAVELTEVQVVLPVAAHLKVQALVLEPYPSCPFA